MLLGAIASSAQNVAFVANKPINGKEFLWVYKKNNLSKEPLTFENLSKYLQLYIDFKLKVADARNQHLDLDTAYRNEIEGYEQALKTQNKLSPKSAEYAYILNEYREGVLMFNISEKEVWLTSEENEQELQDFYLANQARYKQQRFNDVRGEVIADYQQQKEKQWVASLRNKYSVKVDTNALKKLAKP